MNTKKLSSLTVFFPAYNEEGNIAAAVKQALAILPAVAREYEVIVVNDGSQDQTRDIASQLAQRNRHVRVVSQRNKGYGGALKRGFAEAKYEWVFFTDADLQFDLAELKTFVLPSYQSDLVLGFRMNRADGWKRLALARMLKLWNRLWFGFPKEIKDTDCAFKLIKRSVLRSIEPLISDGAMVSTELILKTWWSGYRWSQLGVHHYPRVSGKPTGSNIKVIGKAVLDTFKLIRYYQSSKYVKASPLTQAAKAILNVVV